MINKRFGFLDLTKPFNDAPRLKELFLAYHFSEKGHDVAARALTEFVLSLEQKKTATTEAPAL
ncbi:MAG: hypothetical protein K2Z81_07085 [Cyanobacteria bacterium]|nr:hypothetical protein [Cyanobacteriota bacterium]